MYVAGVAALQKKAHYGGILSGIVAGDKSAEREGALKVLATQLKDCIEASGAPEALHDRCSTTACNQGHTLLTFLTRQATDIDMSYLSVWHAQKAHKF